MCCFSSQTNKQTNKNEQTEWINAKKKERKSVQEKRLEVHTFYLLLLLMYLIKQLNRIIHNWSDRIGSYQLL